MAKAILNRYWPNLSPWIILGAVLILAPIFVFWTLQNIHKQKAHATFLLLEKGAALIRSFEAGARTGMMGMHRSSFRLQTLLTETAQQPDIAYLMVTDATGTILSHSDPAKIGRTHGDKLDLQRISRSKQVEWRQVSLPDSPDIFEVFRRFSPKRAHFRDRHRGRRYGPRGMHLDDWAPGKSEVNRIIFVGLDTGPIEAARRDDMRHTIIMAVILLLIGFAGIVSLFLAQAYRSTKSSLSKVEAFSDNLVANMPAGLLTTDPQGRIVSLNRTAESVLGFSAKDVVGKSVKEALPESLASMIRGLSPEKGILTRETDYQSQKGELIPLDVSATVLLEQNGAFLGHLILFRDLTEIRSLKMEIERSERLASIGRLAAGVAHEIRNPLSSIKGFATYFGERYHDVPEDRKTAEIMIQEVERLNRVIGQLLEFSRPLNIQKKPTSLQALIQLCLKMIEREAHEKGIETRLSAPDGAKKVQVDPDRFKQVFLNLMLNAVEAMETGGTLSVELGRDAETDGILITISDTGAGIREPDLARIFDPYFTTKSSGTGLGLAIVHNIVEAHHGKVTIESRSGSGTTASILLPSALEV
jgi:two-component system sensor histidine kinase HydH